MLKEAAKKGIFFSGPATKRGGGKDLATKQKNLKLERRKKERKNQKMWPHIARGGKALVAGPLKKRTFLRLPYDVLIYIWICVIGKMYKTVCSRSLDPIYTVTYNFLDRQ